MEDQVTPDREMMWRCIVSDAREFAKKRYYWDGFWTGIGLGITIGASIMTWVAWK